MATQYQGNVTRADAAPDSAAGPVIRSIGLSDLRRALQLGWEDFKAVPSHAILLCLIYPVLGLVLARLVHGYSVLPLLFPLAAGFALLGPFRRAWPLRNELPPRKRNSRHRFGMRWRYSGRRPLARCSGSVPCCWRCSSHGSQRHKRSTSAAFGYETAASIDDFATRILTTPQGWWLIIAGCGVGFLFALIALCVSVVSFPIMLDRHTSAGEAMVTSLRAVAKNPVPMAAWGLIVALLLVVGSIPFFLGLAIVIPVARPCHLASLPPGDCTGTQSAAAAAPSATRTQASG